MNPEQSRVLYIEDQPEMIDLVRLTLRRIGCEVLGAMDGQAGLAMMRELKPDLVLLDLMLPGSDGWQIRDIMLADEVLKYLPVVLVTARIQATTSATACGRPLPQADAYITKPFSLIEMRSVVQGMLQNSIGPAVVN